MSIWNKLTGWIDKDRKDLLEFQLEPSQVEEKYSVAPIEAHKAYFRVKLVRMFLKKKVHFMKSWFPAAHSMVECAFGNSQVEIPNVADTSKLFEQQAGTGDVVAKNFHLTPLLPFNGGSVKVVAGLFAMEGENYLNSVIKVMSDFAGLLAVPQLSSALNVAAPLASGLETLFGAGNGRMHLGYHNTFVGKKATDDGDKEDYLRQGYIAVVRAPSADVAKEKLWVVDEKLHSGDTLETSEPYLAHDYMLLQIEIRQERDDWDALTSIKEPFDKAIEALGEDETEKAKTQIRLALAAARQSDDLTKADRSRVTLRLKEEYKKAKEDLQFEGLVSSSKRSLNRMMKTALSVDDALDQGVPSDEELYSDI